MRVNRITSLKDDSVKIEAEVSFRGYTKKEGKMWVAVCIDLNLVAYGKTPDVARNECFSLIHEYLRYVCEEHPSEIEKYIPREAPDELMNEFYSILAQRFKPKQTSKRESKPSRMVSDFSVKPESIQARTT